MTFERAMFTVNLTLITVSAIYGSWMISEICQVLREWKDESKCKDVSVRTIQDVKKKDE